MPAQQNIAFETIVQSALYGNGEEDIAPGLYVINDPKEWEALIEKMNRVNNETKKFTSRHIDFNNNRIIGVFGKILGSGGVKLQIEKIEKRAGKIIVYARYITPQGQLATQIMNQPYHLVLIPKENEKFELEILD